MMLWVRGSIVEVHIRAFEVSRNFCPHYVLAERIFSAQELFFLFVAGVVILEGRF
ncbi:uncharacterized protein DS421_4g108210 [Arachis hypogaea]|nr:uncharacterized protein DS421_4g108210 [Arachis hypogaea]